MKKQIKSCLCFLLSGILMLSLLSAAIPSKAYAVTQYDLDVLAVKRDEVRAQQAEQQAHIDELQAQQASALDLKVALEARTAYTIEQIELNKQEIQLYDFIFGTSAAAGHGYYHNNGKQKCPDFSAFSHSTFPPLLIEDVSFLPTVVFGSIHYRQKDHQVLSVLHVVYAAYV